LPGATVAGLLDQTGRWPLLVRLVSKFLASQAAIQPDISVVAEDLLERLRADGALQVDVLTGASARQLNVADPDQAQPGRSGHNRGQHRATEAG
jgi:hypothetical protein